MRNVSTLTLIILTIDFICYWIDGLFFRLISETFQVFSDIFYSEKSFIMLTHRNSISRTTYSLIGAGTRSRIQARLSGMNIYYARISKLVSDFLSLEWSLVTNSAHAAHVPALLQATWAELVTKDRLSDKKFETSFEVLA